VAAYIYKTNIHVYTHTYMCINVYVSAFLSAPATKGASHSSISGVTSKNGGGAGVWKGGGGGLEELDVGWNAISGRGAVAVLEGVLACESLRIVDVSWNGLGDADGTDTRLEMTWPSLLLGKVVRVCVCVGWGGRAMGAKGLCERMCVRCECVCVSKLHCTYIYAYTLLHANTHLQYRFQSKLMNISLKRITQHQCIHAHTREHTHTHTRARAHTHTHTPTRTHTPTNMLNKFCKQVDYFNILHS